MAVGRVEHENVDAGIDQRLGALEIIRTDSGGGTELVMVVAVVIGLLLRDQGLDVEEAVKPGQPAVRIDHRELADLVFEHDPVSFLHRHAVSGDNRLLRHHIADFDPVIGQEFDVAGRDDADEPAGGVDDRETGERVLPGAFFIHHLFDGLVLAENHRSPDDAVQVVLDLADFVGLAFDRQILVNHADAAELRHGDGHRAFGHGIHRGADERDVQLDVPREAARDVRVVRQEVGVLRHQ